MYVCIIVYYATQAAHSYIHKKSPLHAARSVSLVRFNTR